MENKFKLLWSVVAMCVCTIMVQAQVTASNNVAINGSPYMDDAYVNGVIKYANRNHSVPIRYNIYQDLIEYQQGGKALVLDPNATIKKVSFGSSTFVPLPYDANGKTKFGYFAVLDSGKLTLLARKKMIFLEAKKGGALDGSDQPAQYKKSADTFYYKIGDGELQEVENIKSLITSLPDKQEELTTFAKKEKISPRKEKEIIRFVQYYNSLQ